MEPLNAAWAVLKRDNFLTHKLAPFERDYMSVEPGVHGRKRADYARDYVERLTGKRMNPTPHPFYAEEDPARRAFRYAKYLHDREQRAFEEASKEGEMSMRQVPFLSASEREAARQQTRRPGGMDSTRWKGMQQLGWEPAERFAEYTPQTFGSTARRPPDFPPFLHLDEKPFGMTPEDFARYRTQSLRGI